MENALGMNPSCWLGNQGYRYSLLVVGGFPALMPMKPDGIPEPQGISPDSVLRVLSRLTKTPHSVSRGKRTSLRVLQKREVFRVLCQLASRILAETTRRGFWFRPEWTIRMLGVAAVSARGQSKLASSQAGRRHG